MFGTVGEFAVGQFMEPKQSVTYNPLSRPTGDFTSLLFKTRPDYIQPSEEVEVPAKYAIVSGSTPITIANTATGWLTLDTEIKDTDGIVSLVANEATMALTDEYYDVDVVVRITDNSAPVSSDGYLVLRLYSTGASDDVYPFSGTPNGSAIDSSFFGHQTFHLLAGEVIGIGVENHTGHSLDAYVTSMTITQKP